MNWRDAAESVDGVGVASTYLAGPIWGENIGWLNVGDGPPDDGVHYANSSGLDFGVNISDDGGLFGYAWGENVGWITFDTSVLGDERARFDPCQHRFFGYAWGENIGWINLGDIIHFVGVGPCAFGDHDCAGEIDLYDHSAFVDVLAGPGTEAACAAFDHDNDGDVDLADFAAFQRVFRNGK